MWRIDFKKRRGEEIKLRLVDYLNYVVLAENFQDVILKVRRDKDDVTYRVSKKKMKKFKKKVLKNIYTDLGPLGKSIDSKYFVFQSVKNFKEFWRVENQGDVRFGYELERVSAKERR